MSNVEAEIVDMHPPRVPHDLYEWFQRIDTRSLEVFERLGHVLRDHIELKEHISQIRSDMHSLRTHIDDLRGETRGKLASMPDLIDDALEEKTNPNALKGIVTGVLNDKELKAHRRNVAFRRDIIKGVITVIVTSIALAVLSKITGWHL